MKHRFLYIIALLIVFAATAAFSACNRKGDEPVEPLPVETPKADRTVLVYMVASNNLGTSRLDFADIEEMSTAVKQGDLNGGRLLVYHATTKTAMLKEVTPEGIDTLKIYDNDDYSVSIARMREVVADTKSYAPANDYGLVLWSHASGWLQDGITEDIPAASGPQRSFGVDGLSNAKRMNITSLAYALDDADFSFIYFDCCYMGSVETLYELRHCARAFIASSAEIHANGMPYDENIKHFFNPSLDTKGIALAAAKSSFEYYNSTYVRGDCPITFAVIIPEKLDALADATKNIYMSAANTYKIGYNYQKFQTGTCYYYDMRDYVTSICDDTALLEAWDAALAEAVIYTDASEYVWNKFPIDCFCGLSTYIMFTPNEVSTKNYNTLSWYNDVVKFLYD